MHALDVVFWSFFAAIVAFIAWTSLKLFAGALSDSRSPRNAGRGRGSGGISGDSATLMTAADHGSSVTLGEVAGSDASGSDSGGDFSGGGGESGGGGSSGGW